MIISRKSSSPSRHQHSDETSASQKQQQQQQQQPRRLTTYLAVVGILVFFDFFHGVVFPIVSSPSDKNGVRFPFMLRKSHNRPHLYNPFQNLIRKKCVPQPNQAVSKLDYHIETKKPANRTGVVYAFCRFLQLNIHFPHAMQQLYRCYSLWRDYPNAVPVLMVPNNQTLQDLHQHQFLAELLTVFRVQMNMTTVLEDDLDPSYLENYRQSESTVFESFDGHDYNIRHTKFLHRIVGKELNLPDDKMMACGSRHSKPRIGILNRADKNKRTILNVKEIAKAIQEFSRNESVQIKYFEDAYFKEQVTFFRSVDILLSPHGAQLAGVAFMNAPCAHVVELFPKKYHLPRFFGSLVIESKKEYSHIYLSGNSSRSEITKNFSERHRARKTNLCPSVGFITDTIREIADEWRQCCDQRIAAKEKTATRRDAPNLG